MVPPERRFSVPQRGLIAVEKKNLPLKGFLGRPIPNMVTLPNEMYTNVVCVYIYIYIYIYIIYTECPRRNVPDFGRVFLMLKYTDVTQNTYAQS